MMKISKLEYISIIVCIALLSFGAGWFLRGDTVAAPVEIETQYTAASSVVVATTQPTVAPTATPTPVPIASQSVGEVTVEDVVEVVETDVLLVNINTADEDELQKLSGIGEKRAADIIAYREANGSFKRAEDITNVSGIGEGILEGIIDFITVE